MKYETLFWSFQDKIARITMNRPENANSLCTRMSEELFDAACRCETEGAKAVILTGSGKMFNSGGDLAEFASTQSASDQVTRMATMLHAAISRFAHLDAPLITAVNGSAAGAGFSMALAGDIILASDKAKFVSAYTASGLSPDGSATYFLAKHIGLLRAKELVLTNRVLSAQEAFDWGMVSQVVAPEHLLARAQELAITFANGPTKALGCAKQLLETAYSDGLETQMDKETRSIAAMMRTHDGAHGINAFLSKQKPHFKGY